MVLSVFLHREVWCCQDCSIEKYGVLVAQWIRYGVAGLHHREVWYCPCCSLDMYGVRSEWAKIHIKLFRICECYVNFPKQGILQFVNDVEECVQEQQQCLCYHG